MQAIETVLGRMRQNQNAPALFWHNTEYSYAEFLAMIDVWSECLLSLEIGRGTVCGVLGEYSPQICALFFALLHARACWCRSVMRRKQKCRHS